MTTDKPGQGWISRDGGAPERVNVLLADEALAWRAALEADPAAMALMSRIVFMGRKNGITLPRPWPGRDYQLGSLAELGQQLDRPEYYGWPAGWIVTRNQRTGHWTAAETGDTGEGCRYSARRLSDVHEMVTGIVHVGARD